MKVIIAAGGTGGHIFPGIAIAQEWKIRDPLLEITFVGTVQGLESRIIPREGFPLEFVTASALKNISWKKRFKGISRLPLGLLSAFKLLKKIKPDIVIGVGGYASGFIVLAASVKNIPTMIVEPNALPGFTNRILGRFVKIAAVTFKESAKFFPGKFVLTGNPVRSEFENIFGTKRPKRNHVLVFGGSQGAHRINEAMIEAVPIINEKLDNFFVTHQTGESDYELVKSAYKRLNIKADVRPFIEDMATYFRAADLLICRAGATTVAEIAAAGKAAIFIPFPQAADDHQRKNAEVFAQAGAGKMIVQSELNGSQLANEILSLLITPEIIAQMEEASHSLFHKDAAKNVVDLALKISQRY